MGGFNGLASEPGLLGHYEPWKVGRGFRLFINLRNPGRLANSAPLMPSST
jgi:hypothetical protein